MTREQHIRLIREGRQARAARLDAEALQAWQARNASVTGQSVGFESDREYRREASVGFEAKVEKANDTSLMVEDWYTGYVFEEDALIPDADVEMRQAMTDWLREVPYEERDELLSVIGADFAQVKASEQARADETMAWLHRDEAQSDAQIIARWCRPDDELDEIEQIEQNDERAIWHERMLAFHEKGLHRRLVEYFGTADYMSKELVLRWESKNGRFVPAEKIVVAEWITAKIEEKETRLSGVAYCNAYIRGKIARKKIARDASGQSGSFVAAFNAA